MKVHGLLFSLLFLSTADSTAIGQVKPPISCALACPRPLCANPVLVEGECCPSCENSQCKFEGCVQFLGEPGSKTVQWKPDGCSTCVCADNQTLCGAAGCHPAVDPCFGQPLVASPTDCCGTCDYGIPEDECAVIPVYSTTYHLGVEQRQSNSDCSVMVTFHGCDKRGYLDRNGQRYQCNPVMGQLSKKLSGRTCGALTEFAYEDVVKCEATRNDNLDVGCDIFVE